VANERRGGFFLSPGAEKKIAMKMRSLAGYGFLLIGAAGCLLPVMPGIPFLIAGAAILGWDHPLVRPWAKYLRKQKPPDQDLPRNNSSTH